MFNLINDQKEKCNKLCTLSARTIALYHADISQTGTTPILKQSSIQVLSRLTLARAQKKQA
jgi:hypothetical protein